MSELLVEKDGFSEIANGNVKDLKPWGSCVSAAYYARRGVVELSPVSINIKNPAHTTYHLAPSPFHLTKTP